MRREPGMQVTGPEFERASPRSLASARPGTDARRRRSVRPPPRLVLPPHAPRHAHRPVRRHLRSAARRASRRQPARHEAAQARPDVVAGDARQSAEGHARACGRWSCAWPKRAQAGQPSAHRRHRSRSCHQHALHLRHAWNIWCAAAPGCDSSGSWAPTICGASTAGKAGAASRICSRWRWSTAWDRASTPPAAAPPRRWRATAFRNIWPPDTCRPEAAGLGLSARTEIAAVLNRAPRALRQGRLKPAGAACLSYESWPRRFRGVPATKGKEPLTPIAAPRARARRVPEPVSKR